MGKGLVNGMLVGFLISGSALAIASLMAPPIDAAREIATEATGGGNAPETEVSAEVQSEPAAEPVVEAEAEEAAAEAAPTEVVPEPEPESVAATEPETVIAEVEEPVIVETEAAPEVQDLQLPAESAAEPSVADVAPEVSEAAQVTPDTPVLDGGAAVADEGLPEAAPATIPDAVAENSATSAAAQDLPAVAEMPEIADPAPTTVPVAPDTPTLEGESVQDTEEKIIIAAAPEPQATEPAAEPVPEPDVADESASDGPVILTVESQPLVNTTAPQPGFSQAVPGVKINRLPSIGDTTEPAVDEPAADVVALPSTEDMPAVERYAAPFDNPDSLPIIGVVLIDRGEQDGGPDAAALAAIGLPVTVAIDPTRPDAGERAAAYRAAGLEIAILAADLPSGAKASDMEVSYQAFVQALPETVSLIGRPDAAFQSDRRLAQHLVALLSADGRGLVTYDRGLNPAQQAAFRHGLPHASVYRELDAGGENAAAIARYLDRVAFEAARQGEILVAGTTAPATVQALKDWVTAGAKGTVIAPASAVMLARQ